MPTPTPPSGGLELPVPPEVSPLDGVATPEEPVANLQLETACKEEAPARPPMKMPGACSDDSDGSTRPTDSANTKAPKHQRISSWVSKTDLGGRPSTAKLEQLVREWDKDGDGTIDIHEVVEGCRQLMAEQDRAKKLRRLVIVSIVMGILGCIAMFAITKAVVETSKEIRTNPASTALVDNQGLVVSTAAAEAPLNLADLTRLPIGAFKQVNRLTFRTDSGEHFMQIAMATKTKFGLSITGQDGSTLQCSAQFCEADLRNSGGRTERVWVGSTPSGRRLEAHEHATVDMAFAGYNAPQYAKLVAAAVGDPGVLSLDRVLPSLKDGNCAASGVLQELAEACGLEGTTNVIIDAQGVCSDNCGQGLHELLQQCGSLNDVAISQGRRLASTDSGARTAAELIRYIQKGMTGCTSSQVDGSGGLEEDEVLQSTEPAGQAKISAHWSNTKPTTLELRREAATFLRQTIIGVRLTDDNNTNVVGPLLFTPDNAFIDAKETKTGDFLTIYSVLPLGPKSALRVIVSQVLAKSPQTLKTVQVGPTAVCVGLIGSDGACNSKALFAGTLKFSIYVEAVGTQYALPAKATRLSLLVDLKPAVDATVSMLPAERVRESDPVSLETMRLTRSDGSTIWSYRFDQTYNVDNQRTLPTVQVRPSTAAAAGLKEPVSHLLSVELPVRRDGALLAPGSLLMYDPETFSGNEKVNGADRAFGADLLGIVGASFVYKKFMPHDGTGLQNIEWLLKNSPMTSAGNWQVLDYTGTRPCGGSCPAEFRDRICCGGSGRFGAAYGMYLVDNQALMTAVVSFAGTNDADDVKQDICAAVPGKIQTVNGKEAALGFWQAYALIRTQFAITLKMLRDRGVERLILSGHSLGAAIASIATVDLPSLEGGYFAGDRHLLTVTIGEPPAWNWPNLAFGTTTQFTETNYVSSGRRRWNCDWWLASACPQQPRYNNKFRFDAGDLDDKVHRWATSIKQQSPQCAWWEWAAESFFSYKCETFDWDIVTGLPTLGGNGMHGSTNLFWLGFDATAGTSTSAVNIYRESASLYDYRTTFSTLGRSFNDLPWPINSIMSSLACGRRMSDTNVSEPSSAVEEPAMAESDEEAAKARRLGLLNRVALHNNNLYLYWMVRSLCEDAGVSGGVGNSPCDCPTYCLAWDQAITQRNGCRSSGSAFCTASNVDNICTDNIWKADKCNCHGPKYEYQKFLQDPGC